MVIQDNYLKAVSASKITGFKEHMASPTANSKPC